MFAQFYHEMIALSFVSKSVAQFMWAVE